MILIAVPGRDGGLEGFMNIKRKIFFLFYNCISSKLPDEKTIKPLKVFRNFVIRNFITSMGNNVNIGKRAELSYRLSIGNNSGVGRDSIIQGEVAIGDYVMMGPRCIIYTRNHEFSNIDIPMVMQGFSDAKPVTIADNVWIGARVTILPGVKIGEGSVIGAGSVVTKNIPDNVIAAGSPCRVIRRNQ